MIAYYVGAVKRRAEQAIGRELRHIVHGRPVHFVDNAPDADRKAERVLRDIAREVGLNEVTFQFEPIAAALDYERQISAEEIALIADVGGGTSDFSIVRLGPRRHGKVDRSGDILANDGIRIGGTDFDRQLSLMMLCISRLSERRPRASANTNRPSIPRHSGSTRTRSDLPLRARH